MAYIGRDLQDTVLTFKMVPIGIQILLMGTLKLYHMQSLIETAFKTWFQQYQLETSPFNNLF